MVIEKINYFNKQISKDVAFTPGKAFVKYRRSGGKNHLFYLTCIGTGIISQI